MKTINSLLIILMFFLPFPTTAGPDSPAPPEFKWKGVGNMDTVVVVSLSDEMPFGFAAHQRANSLQGMHEACYDSLNKAMYWQDSYHQFESKAHFDNCAFTESLDYIQQLINEAKQYMAEQIKEDDKSKSALKAVFSLGQALHGIQDFYAHSNYIELMVETYQDFDKVPLISVWTEEGRKTVETLAKGKLNSGRVWWGFPKLCSGTVPSHKDMAKDSASTYSGKKVIKTWENLSQFKAAREIASQASLEFIKDMYKRFDLQPFCGDTAVYTVFVDKRSL